MNSSDSENKISPIEMPNSLGPIDPRADKDFKPELYPRADGLLALRIEPSERDDRIKLEFCAIYYELNRLHAALIEVRRRVENADREHAERTLMQQIDRYLQTRDELEDRCAPLGVIAEAIAQNGFTVDIRFTFGDRTVFRQQRTRLLSSTALLFFPEEDTDTKDDACKS